MFLKIFTLFLCALATGHSTQPNIIFIEVDDLPAHYTGYMGADFALTPTLDQLAKEGTVFRRAVCQGTQCGPSRNSLIIGRYPHNIGMYENGSFKGLPNGVWTLPKALQKVGYKTAHIGKSHIHPSKEGLEGSKEYVRTQGHHRLGFNVVWQSLGRAVVGGKDAQEGVDRYVDFLIEKKYFDQMKNDKGKPTTLPDDIYLDGLFTKLASEFILSQNSPYFLWLNYSVPHGPYDVKQSYHDKFESVSMPTPNAADDQGKGIPSLLRPHPIKSQKKNLLAQKGNCASINFMDDQLKLILDTVEKSGQAEQTIIVFFSDHGILVGDHGLTHKSTLYKEVLNPSLIIKDPRKKTADIVEQPVQLLDLIKTTLEWGNAKSEDFEVPYGDSLTPLLYQTSGFDRDYAVGESPGYFAIVTQKHKYIAPFDWLKDGQTILFDLENDPHETKNIADAYPEIIKNFQKKAEQWLKQSGKVLPPPDLNSK